MPAPTLTQNTRKRAQKVVQPVVVGANDLGKLPPQSLELEEAVLGALMIQKDAFGTVSDLLRPESFYDFKNKNVYQAIQSLAAADQPIDALTVVEKLKQLGLLEQAGGAVYVASLTRKVASSAHLLRHAQILAQKATSRDLITYASDLIERAYDEQDDVDELLQRAEGGVFEISQRQQKKDVTQIDPVIKEAITVIREASKKEGNISGVQTGFHELDKVTSGWQRSDLIIIAARPAMGKTAFVLSMAKQMAVDYHQPVAMFSLEMSNRQLVNRLISNVCQIEGGKIRNGSLTPQDWEKLDHQITNLMGAPIFVDDTPGLSIFELRSKARKLKREHNISCIIIDYLQLMSATGMNPGSREQEVSMISRSLKGLAKELDIPIIALSQLNRSVESRGTGAEGKRPQLSDLRESGAIEQDADMVCFIHRPEYYFRNGDKSEGYDASMLGMAEIIIAKHRNGATKTVVLRFIQDYATFANREEFSGGFDANTFSAPNLSTDNSGYTSRSSKMNAWNSDGINANSLNTAFPESYPSDMAMDDGGEAPF
ncbi:MAG: replicative DNA helicase [Paludibacteraceae bacterium]|nr:replicative DNA helicase [Paludibacteraceae bacterium]